MPNDHNAITISKCAWKNACAQPIFIFLNVSLITHNRGGSTKCPWILSNPKLLIHICCVGATSNEKQSLGNMFYDFESDGDLHAEHKSRISVFGQIKTPFAVPALPVIRQPSGTSDPEPFPLPSPLLFLLSERLSAVYGKLRALPDIRRPPL